MASQNVVSNLSGNQEKESKVMEKLCYQFLQGEVISYLW